MATTLYKLDFASGKSYIGICRQGRDRYKEHSVAASRGSQPIIYCAWRKYGAPNQSILAVVEDKDAAITEQKAIKAFDTMHPGGYNMTPGGEISPMLVPEIRNSKKMRKRMSLGQKRLRASRTVEQELERARKCWVTRRLNGTDHWQCETHPGFSKGNVPWNKGILRDEETKRKISSTLTGHLRSEESKQKQSISLQAYWAALPKSSIERKRHAHNLGKTFSDQTIQRMSNARKLFWKRKREGTS